MIERIFGYGKKSSEPPVDCFECRMVGGTGLSALGSYIMYYSFKQRHSRGMPTIFLSSFLGSIVFTLGLLRLTGLNEPLGPAPTQAQISTSATNNET